MIISKFFVSTASCMFVINATCNGCRLVALYFGDLNLVFNTWIFIPTKFGLKLKSSVVTLAAGVSKSKQK